MTSVAAPGARLVLVGISHKQAPIALRERLHVGAHEAGEVARRLAAAGEAMVLATCNRVELYLAGPDPAAARSRGLTELARRAGVSPGELAPLLEIAEEAAAARHLFRVTAGLESIVIGEPQILGQVREARRLADAAGACGPLLHRLVDHALFAGKRVRVETQLAATSGSIAAAAAQLVQEQFGTLQGRRILIVGTGKIGGLAAATLVAPGTRCVFAAPRGLERAAALAARFGGRVIGLGQLGTELERADVVISCTRCPQLVLDVEQVAAALPARNGAPLLLIDLAVPRDLDPQIGELPGCTLYDLDAVGSVGEANTSRAELRHADEIVAAEVARFEDWRRGLGVAPDIASLRRRAEEIRVGELARAAGKLAALSPEERRAVEAMTAQIVNKLLHLPTVRAKEAGARGDATQSAAAFRHLFGLEEVA